MPNPLLEQHLMSAHRRVFPMFGLWIALFPGAAAAQGLGAGAGEAPKPIPYPLKSAAAISPADQELIRSTVAGNFRILLGSDPTAQQEARDRLINDSRAPGGPSAAYVGCFVQAVVEQITMGGILTSGSVRARLNAAVAVERIAEGMPTGRWEPAVLALLDEKQPYVVRLWGVRAAQWIVPDLVRTKAADRLVAAVVAAAKKHRTGAIAAEAYRALGLADSRLAEALLDLLVFRIDLYRKGLPDDPSADGVPFHMLVSDDRWLRVLSGAQRLKWMQAFCDSIMLIAHHGDAQGMGTAAREQLQVSLDKITNSLYVLAERTANSALATAARTANQNLRQGIGFLLAVRDLPGAIRSVKGFESVQPPGLNPPPATNPVLPVY